MNRVVKRGKMKILDDPNAPYIRVLHIDDKSHLSADMSDGTSKDVGYLPTSGITIYYKEDSDDESND